MPGTPRGWITAEIGHVARLLRGVAYDKADSATEPKDGLVPILRATNIEEGLTFSDLVYVPSHYISEDQYLSAGDVVIAASSGSRSVVGKSSPLRQDWHGSFGAFCFVLRPETTIVDPLYLAYFLQSAEYRNEVSALAAGVNINNLKRQHLETFKFPLAPLPEQRRIVQAIESHFTRLEAAVATLKRVKANLTRYRASVLKAAVEGRLVPAEAELARKEGREHVPASVLLKRILEERRRRWEEAELAKLTASGKTTTDDRWKSRYEEPVAPDTSNLPELPKGWCWATVDQLVTEALCNGHSVATGVDGFPVLRLTALRGGRVDLSERKIGAWSRSEAESYLVKRWDFLVARGNGSLALVGRGGLVEAEPDPVAYPDTLIRVRVSAAFTPRLFVQVWNSAVVRTQIESTARTTAGIYKINQTDLSRVYVPLAPESEQPRILEALEEAGSFVDAAERTIGSSLARCQRLRQAILKWAFAGKLVDQDPTDELASALLERIKAERQKIAVKGDQTPGRGRKRKTA